MIRVLMILMQYSLSISYNLQPSDESQRLLEERTMDCDLKEKPYVDVLVQCQCSGVLTWIRFNRDNISSGSTAVGISLGLIVGRGARLTNLKPMGTRSAVPLLTAGNQTEVRLLPVEESKDVSVSDNLSSHASIVDPDTESIARAVQAKIPVYLNASINLRDCIAGSSTVSSPFVALPSTAKNSRHTTPHSSKKFFGGSGLPGVPIGGTSPAMAPSSSSSSSSSFNHDVTNTTTSLLQHGIPNAGRALTVSTPTSFPIASRLTPLANRHEITFRCIIAGWFDDMNPHLGDSQLPSETNISTTSSLPLPDKGTDDAIKRRLTLGTPSASSVHSHGIAVVDTTGNKRKRLPVDAATTSPPVEFSKVSRLKILGMPYLL